MKNKKNICKKEKSVCMEIKENIYSYLIVFLCLTGAVIFLLSSVLVINNKTEHILCIKGIMGIFIMAEVVIVLTGAKLLCDGRKFRYVIHAMKRNRNKKNCESSFSPYLIYTDDFMVTGDGRFDVKTPAFECDTVFSSENDDYEEFLYQRTLYGKYSFYTKIYDRKEKKYLSQEEISNFLGNEE